MTALPLVFFLRYYVGLPPLIRRGRATQPVSECDAALICFEHRVVPPRNNRGYVEEVCALNHGEQCGLGPTAGHSINCPSTFAARYRAHNGYTRLFQTAAGWLDTIVCHREPPTTGILMDEFTYDECRALCPKILTVEKAALATLFHETMMQLASIDINIAGHETEMTDVQHRIATAITALGNSTKGVRLDLLIELPDAGKDLLCDFSGVHPTAVAHLSRLKKFVTALDISDTVAAGVAANNPTARKPSPAVEAAEKLKRQRYATLMEIAIRQLEMGKRDRKPILIPAIITHLGELGPGLISLVEELTACAGRQYRPNSPFSCGRTKARATAAYRTKLKDALLAANAEGFVRALMATGNPIGGWVSAPDDADLGSWDVGY